MADFFCRSILFEFPQSAKECIPIFYKVPKHVFFISRIFRKGLANCQILPFLCVCSALPHRFFFFFLFSLFKILGGRGEEKKCSEKFVNWKWRHRSRSALTGGILRKDTHTHKKKVKKKKDFGFVVVKYLDLRRGERTYNAY